jgi:uncharacterized protein YcbK (DUF882 family)
VRHRVLAAVVTFSVFLTAAWASAGTYASSDLLKNLTGLSGKLRSLFVTPKQAESLRELGIELTEPGIYPFLLSPSNPKSAGAGLSIVVLTPFSAKIAGKIEGYNMGAWPEEESSGKKSPYAAPSGFIKVTSKTAKRRVSEHFDFGDFLTKDQSKLWPKYLVLDPRLLDKLELTIEELHAMGHKVNGLHVMSGFRTPEYNDQDLGPSARSAISRHMYGDAADVYPDDDGDDRMDDLDHDGKVDLRDARILAKAAEEVEKKFPALVGGIAIYPATAIHGPFVHIDTRGKRARWGEK